MPTLTLPYPVSTNRLYRKQGGYMVKSDEARRYQNIAASIAMEANVIPMDGNICLTVTIHPRKTKKEHGGAVRCLDVSNAIKCAEDALNGIAWLDDKQVVELFASRGQPLDGGALVVSWEPA